MLPGVFLAKKKDGSVYYRSNITLLGKHISLGSYLSEEEAHAAYEEALLLFTDASITIDALLSQIHTSNQISCFSNRTFVLSYEKVVPLLNFRDHKLYIHTPIYLRSSYFEYFLNWNEQLKFDIEDLFYYSSHKIQKRGNRLFVSDYGMQTGLGVRYGIKNYAVLGKDYAFVNHDTLDYRYSNLKIYNIYQGVDTLEDTPGFPVYRARIHIRGLVTVGIYKTAEEAAISYNKAIAFLAKHGYTRQYTPNYIESFSTKKYKEVYQSLTLSESFCHYVQSNLT